VPGRRSVNTHGECIVTLARFEFTGIVVCGHVPVAAHDIVDVLTVPRGIGTNAGTDAELSSGHEVGPLVVLESISEAVTKDTAESFKPPLTPSNFTPLWSSLWKVAGRSTYSLKRIAIAHPPCDNVGQHVLVQRAQGVTLDEQERMNERDAVNEDQETAAIDDRAALLDRSIFSCCCCGARFPPPIEPLSPTPPSSSPNSDED